MRTSVDQISRIDFRRRRAESLVGAIMVELEDVIDKRDVDLNEVYFRLFDLFYRNGAAWTTDAEREQMGFEARDNFGWTGSERVEAKRQRQDALLSMINFVKPHSTEDE